MSSSKIYSPAEWEEQAATWLSFPHHKINWDGELGEKARKFYFDLILKITKFQPAKVLVPANFSLPESIEKKLNSQPYKTEFLKIPTNDIWIRDYGPFFVKEKGMTKIVETEFNAWGTKFPPWDKDNAVPAKIAKKLKTPVTSLPFIFEGGAIEFNSDGLAITTLPCVYGENRNLQKDYIKIRRMLKKALGFRDILALPNGLHGDHTDGHIDNVARFVRNNRVVMAMDENPKSENAVILHEAYFCLKTWLTKHYGNNFKIDLLPLPPQKQYGKEILPASYMNFIFVNNGLIYPKYYPRTDKIAQEYFEKVFPDRKIIGINAKDIIKEGGSLHCLTKHQSA